MVRDTFWKTLAVFLAFAPPLVWNVLAQGGGGGSGLDNPIGGSDTTIMNVINNVIDALRDTIAPPIVALAVLYGGFQMLFAGGDPEKFKSGQKTLLYAAIGYVIILIASGIGSVIENILAG